MSQISDFDTFPLEDSFTPTDADWQEYCGWLDAQGPFFPEPELVADMSDAEWAAHVEQYLADHDLTEVPF